MMTAFHVQRTNAAHRDGPRFEWLASTPTQDPVTDEVLDVTWTGEAAGEPQRACLTQAEAEDWAPCVPGGSVVRTGAPHPCVFECDEDLAATAAAQRGTRRREAEAREAKAAAPVAE